MSNGTNPVPATSRMAAAATRPAPYRIRYMRLDDVPRVHEIDQRSFPLPWTPRSYVYELTENMGSHMVVIEKAVAPTPRGLFGLFRRRAETHAIVGYAGMWVIAGEAHVSTIAIQPEQRGQKLGEALLSTLLKRALVLAADYCVLEVRVSNAPALALYQKYGFEVTGRRKAYYRDNNEDALLMYVGPLDAAYEARLGQLRAALAAQVAVDDLLATTDPRPRTA
jgi:ribosomal-protein-alanine N-acetyltransferase